MNKEDLRKLSGESPGRYKKTPEAHHLGSLLHHQRRRSRFHSGS